MFREGVRERYALSANFCHPVPGTEAPKLRKQMEAEGLGCSSEARIGSGRNRGHSE